MSYLHHTSQSEVMGDNCDLDMEESSVIIYQRESSSIGAVRNLKRRRSFHQDSNDDEKAKEIQELMRNITLSDSAKKLRLQEIQSREAGNSAASTPISIDKPCDIARDGLPVNWNRDEPMSHSMFRLIPLSRGDPECDRIYCDMEKVGLDVVKVERLQNLDSLEKFKSEIRHMSKKKYPGEDLNIRYLYHGTSVDKACICEEGLDQRLSRMGYFGKGIYFSDTPVKCMSYVGSRDTKGESYLLKCRVILGDQKKYRKGEYITTLKREPEKENTKPGSLMFYDSVLGCPKDYNEYVIYESRRAMIEYIITFRVNQQCQVRLREGVPSPLFDSQGRGRQKAMSADMNTADTMSSLRKTESRDSVDLIRDYCGEEDTTNGAVPDSLNQLGIRGSGMELVNRLKRTTTREHVVRYSMRLREEEFTYNKHYSIFCGTWNVNGQNPSVSLKQWLDREPDPPDIYVIGFQELDLSNQAYVFSDSRKEEQWKNAVRKSLPAKGNYKKVKLIRMGGIMLLVYVKESLVPDLPPSLVDADTVATGKMGIMGKKGGVGVRMTLHNTSLCFINTHLAAHRKNFERRNQDCHDVESKMSFKNFAPPLQISEHDRIFWIGDLNYTINGLDIEKVKTMIEKTKYQDLLCYDQLHRQLGRSDVFKGYKEGTIRFRPTCKYDIGTNEWDSSKKRQIPAWSDRILYKGEGIEQVYYISHPDLLISDHKPVSSLFKVEVNVIDKKKSNKVCEDIIKKLDRLENDYQPQVKLDETEFQFKDVMFIEKKAEILTVCNIGQVPVEFEFINKLEKKSYYQPWLKITPYKSVITPGSSCEIRLEMLVDKSCVATLNASNYVLDDILVLHLTGGKDFFITVNGNFIPSSFGCSLEALVQMHGPIRETPMAQVIEIEQPGSLMSRDMTQGGNLYAIPKEVWRLVDHIWHYGRDEKELFQQRGLKNELAVIRDCLDEGVPDRIPGSVHSVAEALLLFLECLPDPVIPSRVYYRCLECSGNYMLCKQVISQIPEHHKNLFRYLCAFMRELLNHSDRNKLDISILSSIFGEIFLRPLPNTLTRSLSTPAGKAKAMEEEMKRTAFVTHFLTNEFDD